MMQRLGDRAHSFRDRFLTDHFEPPQRVSVFDEYRVHSRLEFIYLDTRPVC